MGRKSIFHPWAVRSNGIIEIYLVERIHWGCRTSAVCRNLHPFYLTDQKNNGSSVEYERKNDNVRANWTVLHQKCSPATAEGWPVHNSSMRNGRIKSRELTASVVRRRGPVVIRTWNRATADGQVCRIIVFPVRATKTRQT